jgi:hypothetical protein
MLTLPSSILPGAVPARVHAVELDVLSSYCQYPDSKVIIDNASSQVLLNLLGVAKSIQPNMRNDCSRISFAACIKDQTCIQRTQLFFN